MPKIKLQMDALRVESFATGQAAPSRGTVHGRQEAPDEAIAIPVTDWRTCQGSECTARTQCHYSCLEACLAPGEDAFRG